MADVKSGSTPSQSLAGKPIMYNLGTPSMSTPVHRPSVPPHRTRRVGRFVFAFPRRQRGGGGACTVEKSTEPTGVSGSRLASWEDGNDEEEKKRHCEFRRPTARNRNDPTAAFTDRIPPTANVLLTGARSVHSADRTKRDGDGSLSA